MSLILAVMAGALGDAFELHWTKSSHHSCTDAENPQ